MKPTGCLYLFEYEDDVRQLAGADRLRSLAAPGVKVLAIEPCAQSLLNREGLRFENSIPYFGRDGHEAVLSAVSAMIAPFSDIHIRDENGVHEGYRNTLVHQLRLFLLHQLCLTRIISRAIAHLRPESLCTPEGVSRFEGVIEHPDRKRYLGHIATGLCRRDGIPCRVLVRSPRHPARVRTPAVHHLLKRISQKLSFEAMSRLCVRTSRDRQLLIAPDESYNIPRLLQRLSRARKSSRVVFLSSRNYPQALRAMFDHRAPFRFFSVPTSAGAGRRRDFLRTVDANIRAMTEALDADRDRYSFEGLDFRPPLLAFLRQEVRNRLADLHGRTANIARMMRRMPPAGVLSPHAREMSYNLGELCRATKVPAVLVSHGSVTKTDSPLGMVEMHELVKGLVNTHYPFVAVQTRYVDAYLSAHTVSSEKIRTGPLIFGATRRRAPEKEALRRRIVPAFADHRIILHAGTPKRYSGLRLYIYETVDEYIDNINCLIRATRDLSRVHLIIRYRPFDNLGGDAFRSLLVPSEHYSVHHQGRFEDYLGLSDLMVSYSSTAIEEALLQNVPTLLFDPDDKYCHIPDARRLAPNLPAVVAPCYHVASGDHLGWALGWIVEHHLRRPSPPNLWDRHRPIGGGVERLQAVLSSAAPNGCAEPGARAERRPACVPSAA